jgi:lipopolysaccharide/colanic/teichoic acid biosynthesis glycosyltransferase
MAKLRLLLIICLAWFAILFRIGSVALWGNQTIELDMAVYAVMILVGFGMLLFPNLGKVNLLAVFTGMAVLYVASMGARGLTLSERSVASYAIDGSVMLIGLVLMRRLAQSLTEFEMAVEGFVMDVKNARLIPLNEGEEQVMQELHRARRFERPVAILYCTTDLKSVNDPDVNIKTDFIQWHITRTMRQRYSQVKIAQAASALTYKSDSIIEYGNDVVICLPETNCQEAEQFARRLSRFSSELYQIDFKIGVAAFPKDGLVFEDLVESAKNQVQYWKDSDDDDNSRSGDVIIDFNERLRIEKEAMWTNKLAFQSTNTREIYAMFKRVFDIVVVVATFPVMLPVMALVALAIKIDDGGPIFYMQPRTGHKGRRFKMYKFRTMVPDAKAQPAQVITLPNGKVQYLWPDKTKNDPRITRVGRVLRKTSLDELPQLLNVLNGDMSIVGPRPTTWDLDKYTLHQTERLTVRPGITGLWQVCDRESTNMDERLIWDMKYIQKMGLSMDVQILWRTVASVFQKKGA